LAQQGFAVVNPTYRLAPEYRFPAAMEDLNAVFAFVMQHAAEYGLDTTNLFGIGDSAGATGMAAYAALLADSEYAANYPFTPPAGLKLRAIALNCGTFSMDDMLEPMRDVLPQTEPEKALHLLDIPKHITAGFPPCYLMTAYGDFNCNQPMKLFAELKNNNIPYQYKVWGDKNNPLGHVFHCNLHDPAAHDANKAETDFFHSHIQN
ncbi:MAG TPA: alpha/beta hydrolase, partial [Ruminococcus sp.]|nr:alpha/beta hydrolase [Ruminococcus sp.]